MILCQDPFGNESPFLFSETFGDREVLFTMKALRDRTKIMYQRED